MEAIDYGTGEYFGEVKSGRNLNAELHMDFCPDTARLDRFRLLNTVRTVCPEHRTANCLRFQKQVGGYSSDGIPLTLDVEVWQSLEHQKCHYKNLTVCGRVWTCPVCTAKINEGRRKELKAVCQAHQKAGGTVLMITKTFSHTRFDSLSEMLSGLSKANDRFWRCADIKKLRKSLNLVGYIRAVELTYGQANGWHPHYHELWLVGPNNDLPEIKKTVFRKWRDFTEKVGLGSPNEEYGVHVRGAADAWAYMTKFGDEGWDYSHEMTKHHVKKAKNNRFTPFSLLRVFNGDLNVEGMPAKEHAKKLFQEYAKVMHRKRQLQYSRGLKDLYEIEEIEDEELVEKAEEDSIRLATIDDTNWKKILWSDAREQSRALVLSFAQKDLVLMWDYINALPAPPKNY
jgi:hypothetical protein